MSNKKNGNKKVEAAKKRKEKRAVELKRATVMCWCIIGVVAFGVLILLGYKFSHHWGWLYRHATAATVNSSELSAADYNFYFYRSYYEYMNSVGSTADSMNWKPDESIPLDEQVMFDDNGTSRTWMDFFVTRADELIGNTFAYYELAVENGYTLTQEQLDDIQYDFDEKIWFEAEEVRQSTVEAYLVEQYGTGMTEEIYMENLTILFTANFYKDVCLEAVEIPEADLDAYYASGADSYKTVTYRLFYLSGKADTEEAQLEKMREAKTYAHALAAAADSEETFIALCEEYSAYNDANSYWTGSSDLRREQSRHAISYFRQWLAESDRIAGDTLVAEASNGYYVAMFLSSSDNQIPSVNLRYFTISGENAAAQAAEFMKEFRQGDNTPEAFFSLCEPYRDIDYSTQYRKIDSITHHELTLTTVPEVLLPWCFAEARTAGDVSVITAQEDLVYVVYFDGYGALCSRVIAYNDLQTSEFSKWEQSALPQVAVKKAIFFYLIGK